MTDVPRDRWSRPLVTDPANPSLDNLIPYQRASTIGGMLEYQGGLTDWKVRLTALGIAKNPHLQMALAAAGEDKRALNDVCTEAFLAEGGQEKADLGTSLHAICEQYDRQRGAMSFIPADFIADLEAYLFTTRNIKYHGIEEFLVCDTLAVAGTPDRIGELTEPLTFRNGVTLPAGWCGIVDLKTGSVDYPHSFAVQLAVYAHSKNYDPLTGERSPLSVNVDQKWAMLVHLPAGAGTCEFHLLDIDQGWRAAALAKEVDKWRKTKNLTFDVRA